MQTAPMTHTPEKKKVAPAPNITAPSASPLQNAIDTPAGIPLFLQRASYTVNEPGDIYEQEANRAADLVMRKTDSAPPINLNSTPRIQRCACGGMSASGGECAACREKRLGIQRKAANGGGMTAPANIVPSGGHALPSATRAHFESQFGHDFSTVRVHTGGQAAENARSINARAFTTGQDVVFGAGEYNPHTSGGQYLLAHELAHVVQQSGRRQHVQRKVTGDIRVMGITRSWAEALNDDEMIEQVRIVREQINNHAQGTPENQSARDNLAMLEQVQNERNLRRLAVTGGVVTEQTVARPPGIPPGGGFTLIPAPANLQLPPEVLNQIPEGQLVDAPPAMMAAAMTPQASTGGFSSSPFLGDVGMASSVTGMSTLSATGQHLRTFGFAAAGENAIGFVAIPRLGTPGQLIPQSTSIWGHTAMYVRQGGRITIVRGFMPGGMVDTVMHAGQIEAGLRGTPAAIANDTRLFLNTGARSVEYAVDPALAAQAAESLPEVGPVGSRSGLPTEYTARPSVRNVCTQSNCGLWAVEQMEQHLGGQVGPRPGVSVTALGEGGAVVPRSGSQGRLIGFSQGDSFAPVPRGTNPTTGGMSTGFKVLRWGGRIFFVVGVALTVAEIAMAKPEDRERTAVGATAGFVGGLAFGAAAGLVCGPGAPVCSVVLGITFGVLGGLGSRALAEEIYDETHPNYRGHSATPEELMEFNAAWQRATRGRCPSGNCHMPVDNQGPQFNDFSFPSSSAFAQPGTHGTGFTQGAGLERQLSEQDIRRILEFLEGTPSQTSSPSGH